MLQTHFPLLLVLSVQARDISLHLAHRINRKGYIQMEAVVSFVETLPIWLKTAACEKTVSSPFQVVAFNALTSANRGEWFLNDDYWD
jgi:hypothetical protein